ncbi:MAG: hypothetical protein ACRDT4_04450 [Micromonosporaceae bacterium]
MQTAGWDPIRGQWVMTPHAPAYRQLPGYGHPFGQPARPTYRESHPVRAAQVWLGVGATIVWFFLFFATLGWSLRAYAWATIVAAVLAYAAASALTRYGDRGVAVGVAATSGFAVSIAALVIGIPFIGGNWILW